MSGNDSLYYFHNILPLTQTIPYKIQMERLGLSKFQNLAVVASWDFIHHILLQKI